MGEKPADGFAPDFVRQEVQALWPAYATVQDCLDGEIAIKAKGTTYLPSPVGTGDKTADDARYESYKTRAVFYSVAQRTLKGLVGQVMQRDPVIEVPDPLKFLLDDIDGTGISAEQLAQFAVAHVLGFGRGGFLTDYPNTSGPITVAQQKAGYIKPTISFRSAQEIINWRTDLVGGKWVLRMLVLRDFRVVSTAEFATRQVPCHRVFTVDEATGIVSQEVFISYESTGKYELRGGDGAPLSEIPFAFIGQTNNSDKVEYPDFYSMCSLNVAHYRNSADYEESVFLVGQPTVWLSGLTQQWVTEVLKGQVMFGSRAALPLPVGGAAGILQVQPNVMAFEAMQHKERQMVALGAKLVEQKAVQRTAFEAGTENASEASTLATIAKNVGDAMEIALRWAAVFQNVKIPEDTTEGQEAIKFELNTDFELANMSANDRAQTIKEWQSGATTFGEMRAVLRKGGIATLDDKTAAQEIADELKAQGLTAMGDPIPEPDPTAFDGGKAPPENVSAKGTLT